ncbi:MAG TPA: ATP-dependent 6-phosphofructokinase, partial [candidate division Zixibacteria bacterium]|nr:ATP-dependent 6-phosphofructokinase [candidate division Zixibacteria bacterium]
MARNKKRLGILTGGGDCPGLNAAIRAIVRTAEIEFDMEVIGFRDGFEGLVENRCFELTLYHISGLLAQGGTILGTSNKSDPFNYPVLQGDNEEYVYLDRSSQAVRNFEALGLIGLIAIGGDGTMTGSSKLIEKGIPIIGVPKTIDNDLVGTDVTFGFDSALVTATEAIDKLHTTAQSHHRVMIVEVMGRYAGWLALASGLAGGGDIILLPEFPYDIEAICNQVKNRTAQGKTFSIVVVGEGARQQGGEMVYRQKVKHSPDTVRLGGISHRVASQIEGLTNIECRVTILGHLLRGGIPSAADRILATRYGVESVHLAEKSEFGKMVALQNNKLTSVNISDVAGKMRPLTINDSLIKTAVSLGI